MTASDTVEIKNKSATNNILNGRNNSGTSVFSVDNSGTCSTYSLIITCPTGSSIILPTSYTSTPISSCRGYKFKSYSQVGNMTLPQSSWYTVCSIVLPPGIWLVMGCVNCINGSTSQSTAYGAVSLTGNDCDDVAYQQTWYNVLASGVTVGSITRVVTVQSEISHTYFLTVFFPNLGATVNGRAGAGSMKDCCKMNATRIG